MTLKDVGVRVMILLGGMFLGTGVTRGTFEDFSIGMIMCILCTVVSIIGD